MICRIVVQPIRRKMGGGDILIGGMRRLTFGYTSSELAFVLGDVSLFGTHAAWVVAFTQRQRPANTQEHHDKEKSTRHIPSLLS